MGPTGAQSPTGATGAQGPKGDTGATGAQGPAGAGVPTPVVNGQWIKGSGGAAVWSPITGADIANDTITAAQIAPNAIGSSELADASVDFAAFASPAMASGRAYGTFTFSAADTNGRGYTVAKTTSWERGQTMFNPTVVVFVAPSAGWYLVCIAMDSFSAAHGSSVGMYGFLNNATLIADLSEALAIQKFAGGSNGALNACSFQQCAAGDQIGLWSYCSGGGTARFIMSVARLPL